jgi:hypothetical protein
MAGKQQDENARPIQTRLKRLPLPEEDAEAALRVSNRLTMVHNPERAANLFSRILRAVEKANAREAREREEAANGRSRSQT